jgi:carboxypeptidase D
MAEIEKISAHCNYTGYTEKFLTYPPTTSVFPLPGKSEDPEGDYCDLWGLIVDAALVLNPAFDIYFIYQMPPIPWSVVGMP